MVLTWRIPAAAVLIVAAVLGSSGSAQADGGVTGTRRSAAAPMSVQPAPQLLVEPKVLPMVPGPFADPSLDLRAGPVDLRLELRIPALRIIAPMVSVGITAENVMDAPKGLAGDPVWQKAFWYRGSGIPGHSGTATIAGHVDDALGRPAVFAHLRDLRAGDLIVIHDPRSGLDLRFTVVKIATYSVRQAADPSVLAQVYGIGPVSGREPQPAPDGPADLTLITCAEALSTARSIAGWSSTPRATIQSDFNSDGNTRHAPCPHMVRHPAGFSTRGRKRGWLGQRRATFSSSPGGRPHGGRHCGRSDPGMAHHFLT